MTLLSTLTRSMAALRPFGGSPIASTSKAVAACTPSSSTSGPSLWSSPFAQPSQVRFKGQLAPRRTKYRKAHKGRVPIATGGSIKGTTLAHGTYGIRLLAPARLSAKQLSSAETALKRKLKVIKGAQVFLRVFPDIPVCVKGNETRMGKGKGSFEFWATRATVGKVVFEIGGPVEIRPEVAKDGEFSVHPVRRWCNVLIRTMCSTFPSCPLIVHQPSALLQLNFLSRQSS